MHMNHPKAKITLAERHVLRLREVNRLLAAYGHVTGRPPLADLELLSMIEGVDDLAMSENDTFLALVNDGFNLADEDHHTAEHYYQATQDTVSDALEERGLRFDPFESYSMHVGIVGGPLEGDTLEDLDAALRANHGPRIQVHQEGDNFQEWGEPWTAEIGILNTAAARAARIEVVIPSRIDPDAVFPSIAAALPHETLLTAEEVHATGPARLATDKPYALTSTEDHSRHVCHVCRRDALYDAACPTTWTECLDCCGCGHD